MGINNVNGDTVNGKIRPTNDWELYGTNPNKREISPIILSGIQ